MKMQKRNNVKRVAVHEREVRRIIDEEIQRLLREDVDQDAIRDVVNVASKLLGAIKAFDEAAPDGVKSALEEHLAGLRSKLEGMLSNPAGYVRVTPKVVRKKKITLKAVQ